MLCVVATYLLDRIIQLSIVIANVHSEWLVTVCSVEMGVASLGEGGCKSPLDPLLVYMHMPKITGKYFLATDR